MFALILATVLAQLPLQAEPQYVGMLGLAYAPEHGEAGKLDLYAPGDAHQAPVVIYIHGGSWYQGDRKDYGFLGRALARQGAVCVIPSFRQYPSVDAAQMAGDVAAVVAWTVAHVAEYDGDPKRIVLVGHSSGAHLAALVALDPSYLAAAGTTPAALHGLLLLSGAYDVRNQGDAEDRDKLFGATPARRWSLSPLAHAGAAVPFNVAIACAGNDAPGACDHAKAFDGALAASGANVKYLVEPNAAHATEPRSLVDPDDALDRELFELLR